MTPLEKALQREQEDHIDYCTECEHIRIVRGVPYCGISGKLLHPMMYTPIEGGGSGPARNCKKRREAKNGNHHV